MSPSIPKEAQKPEEGKDSPTVWPVLQAFFLLLSLEPAMERSAFFEIYTRVRRKTPSKQKEPRLGHRVLSDAVDLACALYFKPVLCLQRSAAATLLMRRYGLPAEMVIGVQIQPSKSHAWVELSGEVVNDKPYMHEIYQELERC
ncbi:lasso peptide biosynthesis B2 protein [Terriglobus albidus]|uniref:lasso peptide biosynthesis B2 protein n=1 Tax=Terriglobus albidus TaxID=1592106 RepID=UPI0021E067FC|nr:lasso peptide biosynthesis B2 protein [Terriglobus albidus]